MLLLFYTTNISVGVAHQENVCAKVNKGGVMFDIVKTGLPIVYNNGPQVIISKIYLISFSED